ncbi:C-C motif chemokine 12-like [Mixophyes fleayi]|uniref:C-C motif chemokine 12-like n=1 Tax=Mixophyes fleayi TaxID=3061075 RepID=UPI003F4D8B5F
MKHPPVPPLILLGLVLLPSLSQGLGIIAVDKKTCLKLQKTEVPVSRLKSYIQKTIPIEAVLFETKQNKELCADPTMDWVKRAIAELDKRAKNPSMKKPATKKKNTMKKPATKNKNTMKKPATNNRKRSIKTVDGKQKTKSQQSKTTRTPALVP